MAFVLHRPDDPSFEVTLGDTPLSIGSDPEADVRLTGAGIAGCHVLVSRSGIEARADVTLGGVRLRAGRSRACVPSELRVGAATFTIASVAASSVATRELVFRDLSGDPWLWPRLVVVEGPSRGRELALRGDGAYTVGRDAGTDLSVEDPQMSRAHFEVELREGAVFVRDAGATSGVWLGGTILEPRRKAAWPALRMVKAGSSVFAVVGLSPATAPTTSMPGTAASINEPPQVARHEEDAAPQAFALHADEPILEGAGASPTTPLHDGAGAVPRDPIGLRIAIVVFAMASLFAVAALAYFLLFV